MDGELLLRQGAGRPDVPRGRHLRRLGDDASALCFRYERLDDEGLFGGTEQVLQEATATFEFAESSDRV